MLNTIEAAKIIGVTDLRLVKIVQGDKCPVNLTPTNPDEVPLFWQFDESNVQSYLKQSIERQGQAKVLEPAELNHFLSWCNNQGRTKAGAHAKVMRYVVAMSHYTGMRISEIAKLKLSHVVNDDWTLKADALLGKEITKTNKSRPALFSHTKLVPILETQIKKRRAEGANLDDLLLITLTGKPYSRHYLSQAYSKIFNRYGMDNVSSHSGRRFFITEMLSKGVPIKVAQTLAGHTDPGMTARYHEPKATDFQDAIKLVGA